MNRRRIAALAAPFAWLVLLATPATAAEPCIPAVVLCAEQPAPAPAPHPEPEPQPQPQPQPQPTTTAPAQPTEAQATAHLLRRMNEERAARGLPALQRRDDVDDVAQAWSGHLADERRLSHNDAFFTPESRARHGAKALGENVAVNRSPEAAHLALMNSPHHRDNILDARFTVVGLGAVLRDGSWWVTQDFVQPRAAAAAPPVRRAAAPAAPAPAAAPAKPAPKPATTPTPAPVAPSSTETPVAAVAAGAPRPAVVQTLRTEPEVATPLRRPTLAAEAATPTPRTAILAAVAAAAGWVVLAATRRRVRRTTAVIGNSGHHPIPTRFAS